MILLQDNAVVSEQLGCMIRMQSIFIQQLDNVNQKLAAGACQELINTHAGLLSRGTSGSLPSDDDQHTPAVVRSQESDGGPDDLFTQHDSRHAMLMSLESRKELAVWVCTQ